MPASNSEARKRAEEAYQRGYETGQAIARGQRPAGDYAEVLASYIEHRFGYPAGAFFREEHERRQVKEDTPFPWRGFDLDAITRLVDAYGSRATLGEVLEEETDIENRVTRIMAEIEKRPFNEDSLETAIHEQWGSCGPHAHVFAEMRQELARAYEQRAQPHSCGLCGATPPRGIASVTQDGKEVRLCHPDGSYPDCYVLWTVYGHRP